MNSNNGAEAAEGERLQQAISPVLNSGLSLKEMRIILAEMFANSVSNAPDNEIENHTAKRQTPVFLAITGFLENLSDFQE